MIKRVYWRQHRLCAQEVKSFLEARRFSAVADDEGDESPVGAFDDAKNTVDCYPIGIFPAIESNLVDIRTACGLPISHLFSCVASIPLADAEDYYPKQPR